MTKIRELIRKAKLLFGESITIELVVGLLKDLGVVRVTVRNLLVRRRSGNAGAGLLMQKLVTDAEAGLKVSPAWWHWNCCCKCLLHSDAGVWWCWCRFAGVCCLVMQKQMQQLMQVSGPQVLLLGGTGTATGWSWSSSSSSSWSEGTTTWWHWNRCN